jgi:nicotinate-nucleotide--dimethylbenzimidazole phosphoribosyltransferase
MQPVEIPIPDARAERAARARQQTLTKPPGSLGRLEELACWFAARSRNPVPERLQCEVFVFAADHGVSVQGVSAFPQAVTAQMLSNFASGGAAINVLATLAGCRIEVVDVGVAGNVTLSGIRKETVRSATRDLFMEAAMTEEELTSALRVGTRCAQEAAARGTTLLIAGDMGIANTTSAACLICALTGTPPEQVVGRGTGIDDAALDRKMHVVEAAVARVNASSPVQATVSSEQRPQVGRRVLREVGGLEIAAMAGLYIEAARCGIPLLLDGYISGAAALAAVALEHRALRWMLASHRSAEAGHAVALDALGLSPLLDLGMRLGEGTGAALALPLIQAALALHRSMATFAEAGVAGAIDADASADGRP